jgi:hypothetical protein
MGEGGFSLKNDLALVLRTDLFCTGALPAEGQAVTVNLVKYKIDEVSNFDGYVVLQCNQWRVR